MDANLNAETEYWTDRLTQYQSHTKVITNTEFHTNI